MDIGYRRRNICNLDNTDIHNCIHVWVYIVCVFGCERKIKVKKRKGEEEKMIDHKIIHRYEYINKFGETDVLNVYQDGKGFTITDKGIWNHDTCLCCFLGKSRDKCVGSCVRGRN